MKDQPRPLLVITTLLGGDGPTGVETHFNQIITSAQAAGIDTLLITPYTGRRLARAYYRPLKNWKAEIPSVWYQKAQARAIRRQLEVLVRANRTRPVVCYAQCPLSAGASLAISEREKNWQTKLIVHYNQSQSVEIVDKGLAQAGGYWSTFLDRTEATVLPYIDAVFFVSNYMRRIVNGRLPALAGRHQETIFNFPPAPLSPRLDISAGDLVAIGTLEPRKNQLFLLRVLAEAKARGSIYKLGIVGDGPDRSKLEKAASLFGVRDQVDFLGFQSEASRIIPRYRCLAHAARLENCPISILEAFSHGRPVCAAPVGGIPELFEDGVQGRFWNLDNPGNAAEVLIEILNDPRRYESIAFASLQHYEKNFADLPAKWLSALMASNRGPRL